MKENDMLRIGITGLSPGNGHPYSWSAIINGDYDERAMEKCGYAGIPVYLAANKDTLGIDGARVTHVWTQERAISEHIATASLIETVVDRPEDMIGNIDALLLARDDPENHVEMARPFIDADVPVFVDKPLAITRSDLDWFKQAHQAGKFIMSCSSMRYASESRAVKTELAALGNLELATAVGKKDWIKYGVHMLEGLFALLDDPRAVSVKHAGKTDRDIVCIEFSGGLIATVHLFQDICPTFQLSIFGQSGWRFIEYKNWYAMFRDNLIEFIRSVRQGTPRLAFEKTVNIMNALIGAQESLEREGVTILLED